MVILSNFNLCVDGVPCYQYGCDCISKYQSLAVSALLLEICKHCKCRRCTCTSSMRPCEGPSCDMLTHGYSVTNNPNNSYDIIDLVQLNE